MVAFITLLSGLFGLILGSFAGAQVWRLRARQLVQDKAFGDEYDKSEYKKLIGLTESKTVDDRSRCLSCKHELQWYDLIPLFSWVSTKGRCRYCNKRIGYFEPLMELGTAATFSIFSFTWLSVYGVGANALILLILWLIAICMLVILFAYDFKWFLLPDIIMFPLIALSIVIAGLTLYVTKGVDVGSELISIAGSIGILSGLYLTLWLISKGNWVGFGDVKLGLALGFMVMDWKLALLTLFLANLIGCLVVIPGLLTKRLTRKTAVPFGPMLITAAFISIVAGNAMINGYMDVTQRLVNGILL